MIESKGYEMEQKTLFQALSDLLSAYETQYALLESRWPTFPKGFLRFRNRYGKPTFSMVSRQDGTKNESIIAADTPSGNRLLKVMLEKHIVYHGIPTLRRNIRTIRALLSRLAVYDPELMVEKWRKDSFGWNSTNSDSPKTNQELILPDWVFLPGQLNVSKWIADTKASRYRTNPSYPEDLIYPTKQGRLVRSKSEVFWDDALFAANLVFRYDSALVLDNGEIIYPDFIVLHPKKHCLIIIEHFGRMDDPKYAMKNMQRLQKYAENGWIPGRDVFFTMETKEQPLTSTQIDAVLRKIGF